MLLCLAFKWHQLINTFYVTEILISTLEVFLPYADRTLFMKLLYSYAIFNFWALFVGNFMVELVVTCLYFCVFMYAQTIVYSGVTIEMVLISNIPQASIAILAIFVGQITFTKVCVLIKERDFFKSGHLQFVHSL